MPSKNSFLSSNHKAALLSGLSDSHVVLAPGVYRLEPGLEYTNATGDFTLTVTSDGGVASVTTFDPRP